MERRWCVRVLYSLYLLCATLVLLELAVRIWGYAERYLYDPIYMPFQSSADIPFIHKPLLVNARARSSTWFNTDSLGLRSMASERPLTDGDSSEYRIAFVGNSSTFGQGVNTDQTFCVRVEAILNGGQFGSRFRSLNFGVSGYSVKEMAATLDHRVARLNPDLIVASVSFDDFDTTRCGGVDQWGYNVSLKRWNSEDRNSVIKMMLRPIRLAYVARDVWYWNWGEPAHQRWSSGTTFEGVPASYRCVRGMDAAAKMMHVPMVLLALPSSGQSGVELKPIVAQCNQDDIEVLDLSYLGGEMSPQQFGVDRFDSHPSPLVHSRIAEEIAGYIRDRRTAPSYSAR